VAIWSGSTESRRRHRSDQGRPPASDFNHYQQHPRHDPST